MSKSPTTTGESSGATSKVASQTTTESSCSFFGTMCAILPVCTWEEAPKPAAGGDDSTNADKASSRMKQTEGDALNAFVEISERSENAHMDAFIRVLFLGIAVKLYSSGGVQDVKIALQNEELRWQVISDKVGLNNGKGSKKYKLHLREIHFLEWGKCTRNFATEVAKDAPEDKCFSLITKKGNTLDIEVKSQVLTLH